MKHLSSVLVIGALVTSGFTMVCAAGVSGFLGLSGEQPSADVVGPIKPKIDVESELAPDKTCSKPRERFDVSEKLLSYGGEAAELRLQQLVKSGYKYSDLTADDKKMLEYLAKTTVWVPPSIEVKLAHLFTLKEAAELTPYEEKALAGLDEKLSTLKSDAVANYPEEVKLKIDEELQDGAFAKFGGVILLSKNYLDSLSEAGEGADFLLAHEISHVYKRHAMKSMQFKLVSSEEGWKLAQALLGQEGVGGSLSPAAMAQKAVYYAKTIPALIDYVKNTRIEYAQNQEFEADACAALWLRAINVEPKQSWRKYQDVLGLYQGYTPTHPSTQDREKNFMDVVLKNPVLTKK